MGITSELLDFLNNFFKWTDAGWEKLNEHKVPAWVLKKAKKRYNSMKNPLGNRSHFIGKTFFYKVWYRGKRDWVFYRKKK